MANNPYVTHCPYIACLLFVTHLLVATKSIVLFTITHKHGKKFLKSWLKKSK
jgi:hypothetical protein